MHRLSFFFFFTLFGHPAFLNAQNAHQLIAAVRQKQTGLQTVTYTLIRTDTLVTGHVRQMSGQVRLRTDKAERLFGFWFQARQNDLTTDILYDGHAGYELNDATRTYTRLTDSAGIRNLLHQAGGRLVMPDLISLDTTKALRFTLSQNERFYVLTMHYADIKPYDVRNRFKTVYIDRTTLLPMTVRHHQETLGRIQDLRYQIQSIHVNDSLPVSTFREPSFLTTYQPNQPAVKSALPVRDLVGQTAPAFELLSLSGNRVASSDWRGKITLLDFWEVWCGPCLEAMPKVGKLHQQYAAQGLRVYGITHDLGQLDVVKQLVKKRAIDFPTLIGNEQTRRAYELTAIPYYVLIDRQGVVRFISKGFSADLEHAVQQLINQ